MFDFLEGPELVGKLTLPPNFSSGTRYPVLVYVYGGPNFQLVSFAYSNDMHYYLPPRIEIIFLKWISNCLCPIVIKVIPVEVGFTAGGYAYS